MGAPCQRTDPLSSSTSPKTVREVVEGAVGAWSDNEYFEMHVDGLTPQLTS
jgi:hypothetical protein